MENNEPILSVKPKYKIIYQIAKNIETPLIFILLLFFMPKEIFNIYLIMVLIYIMFMIEYISFNILKYKYYKYDFYNTELRYKNSFISKSEKLIKYEDIKEISFNQNILQRIFKIGDITINTNGFSLINSGVRLYDIENVEDIYNQIREIIDNKE